MKNPIKWMYQDMSPEERKRALRQLAINTVIPGVLLGTLTAVANKKINKSIAEGLNKSHLQNLEFQKYVDVAAEKVKSLENLLAKAGKL